MQQNNAGAPVASLSFPPQTFARGDRVVVQPGGGCAQYVATFWGSNGGKASIRRDDWPFPFSVDQAAILRRAEAAQ